MTIDEMKRLARQSLELWSSESSGRPEDVFAPDYLNHQEPAAAGGNKGLYLHGRNAIVAECRTALSDFDVTILPQVAEGGSGCHTMAVRGYADRRISWSSAVGKTRDLDGRSDRPLC